MGRNFKEYLLQVTKSSSCEEIEIIQSLWSGYGRISRYQLDNIPTKTVVIKHISLNEVDKHPRGWNTTNSHNRKVRSYEVETCWYEKWSHDCSENCKVPILIGTWSQDKDQWIILEDLKTIFPLRKYDLEIREVNVCLKWLANFHATFMEIEPKGLWKVGTYWHLQTRPDEFEKIENEELKSKAHLIDEKLNNCKHQTIVHGDAKLANFCFSADGKKVAAVDFQYVGGGCGVKDVAYFLGSCLSSSECERYQEQLLDFYFKELKTALGNINSNIDFSILENEWRKMYPIACTDFIRFLQGWMPTHQKINKYNLTLMTKVLGSL